MLEKKETRKLVMKRLDAIISSQAKGHVVCRTCGEAGCCILDHDNLRDATASQTLLRAINNRKIKQELLPRPRYEEIGVHFSPRTFSPAIAAIFAETNRSLSVDGFLDGAAVSF
jgi:hypothetical protein